jgi:hypothetical protein
MGDFAELAYGHDATARVRISLTFESNKDGDILLDSTFCEDDKTHLPKLDCLTYKGNGLHFTVERNNGHYKASFNYDPAKDSIKVNKDTPDLLAVFEGLQKVIDSTVKMVKKRKTEKKEDRQTGSVRPSFRIKDAFFPTKTEGSYSFKNPKELFEADGNVFLVRRLTEMCDHVDRFSRHANYVSSFRLPPDRTYYRRTKAALKVDKFGDNWIDQLVEWEQAESEEFKTLNEMCGDIGLASGIKTKHYGGGRFEMRINPFDGAIDSALTDVGFGVSQFLPLLIADLQLGRQSTFITSQPEIHLHPKIQAEYVNCLVKAAAKEEKRYILETHSEYLLNRFRLLIVKGEISPEDVAVYYLARNKGGVRNHRLTFKKDGSIHGAPKEFFETYMMDAMEIALHAEA